MSVGISSNARHARQAEPSRQEQRFAVRLSAMLDCGGRSMFVNMRDLSRSGALAEALTPPSTGSSVTLSREQLSVAARVIWVRGGRFGLKFDAPIRATDLFVQLSHSRERASLIEAEPA